jgi:hypothetical protein
MLLFVDLCSERYTRLGWEEYRSSPAVVISVNVIMISVIIPVLITAYANYCMLLKMYKTTRNHRSKIKNQGELTFFALFQCVLVQFQKKMTVSIKIFKFFLTATDTDI